MAFREISLCDVEDNFFDRIGTDWMLVTAGPVESCNTMTASWGQVGVLWNRNVATCYVRPSRYTREFVEREDAFTLSFFAPGTCKQQLELLGTKSGRDGDKIAEAGLKVRDFGGTAGFEEARLVLVCKVLYKQDLREDGFLDGKMVEANYPQKDFHRMYVGEILKVYRADNI